MLCEVAQWLSFASLSRFNSLITQFKLYWVPGGKPVLSLQNFASAILFSLKYSTYAKFWPMATNILVLAELPRLWEGLPWTLPNIELDVFAGWPHSTMNSLLFYQQTESLVITSVLGLSLTRLGRSHFAFSLIFTAAGSVGFMTFIFTHCNNASQHFLLWIFLINTYETTILENLTFFFLHWKWFSSSKA